MSITLEQRNELRRLSQAASPAPWRFVPQSERDEIFRDPDRTPLDDANDILTVESRNALIPLLDALDAADARIAALIRDAESECPRCHVSSDTVRTEEGCIGCDLVALRAKLAAADREIERLRAENERLKTPPFKDDIEYCIAVQEPRE